LKLDGKYLRKSYLQPNHQSDLGNDGYDAGAKILNDFFKSELDQYLTRRLNPIGRKLIECCLNDGKIDDYLDIIQIRL
jgi:hypothetical protein